MGSKKRLLQSFDEIGEQKRERNQEKARVQRELKDHHDRLNQGRQFVENQEVKLTQLGLALSNRATIRVNRPREMKVVRSVKGKHGFNGIVVVPRNLNAEELKKIVDMAAAERIDLVLV